MINYRSSGTTGTSLIIKVRSLVVVLIFLLSLPLYSQPVSRTQAEAFIKSLVDEDTDLGNYVDPYQLQLSDRLGIRYEKVKHKFLISYDIALDLKEKARNGQLDYTIKIDKLADGFSRLLFIVPGTNYKREFYFKAKKIISPVSYYTRNWTHLESTHFRFIISDTTCWNSYCIYNLERFYGKAAELLAFSQEQEEKIKKGKIYYILCKNEEEIKQLTGFHTRGMYNLAYDCIITMFNAHYHELLHLLINYKLERLPLYTHPFFQEGFAVAFGGRGGKEPAVILNLGLFLYESQMLDYMDILSNSGFYQYDVSISYPASGLYNRFLILEMGIERYLELYRKYCGIKAEAYRMIISEEDLPRRERWQIYLNEFKRNTTIAFDENCLNTSQIFQDAESGIRENCDRYYFRMMDTLLVQVGDAPVKYRSKKFAELFSNKRYNREKYLIIANSNEISIYNLYTNNLMAHFAKGFSHSAKDVPVRDGYYTFNVPKSLFDEKLKDIFNGNTF